MSEWESSFNSSMAMGEDGHMDPLEGARRIKQCINRLNYGQIWERAVQLRLNHLCDVTIFRNRLDHYEMRRYYGPEAAPWNPELDERKEKSLNSTNGHINANSSRDIADFLPLQVVPSTSFPADNARANSSTDEKSNLSPESPTTVRSTHVGAPI